MKEGLLVLYRVICEKSSGINGFAANRSPAMAMTPPLFAMHDATFYLAGAEGHRRSFRSALDHAGSFNRCMAVLMNNEDRRLMNAVRQSSFPSA